MVIFFRRFASSGQMGSQFSSRHIQPGSRRFPSRFGLLVNLLEHIVRIPAFFSAGQIPIHMKDRVVTMIAIGVEYADPLTVQHGDLLILKENDVPGVAQQSGNIRCDEALAVPRAHDQRTVVAGRSTGRQVRGRRECPAHSCPPAFP